MVFNIFDDLPLFHFVLLFAHKTVHFSKAVAEHRNERHAFAQFARASRQPCHIASVGSLFCPVGISFFIRTSQDKP